MPRKLHPERPRQTPEARLAVDRDTFDRLHASDPMASDKLAGGIEGFTTALVELEGLLRQRLAALAL